MYPGTTSISYTTVTSTHCQTLSKKSTTWEIDLNKQSVRSLQGLRLLFLDKCDDFASKNKEFYNPTTKNVRALINGMLLAAGIQTKDIIPEPKKVLFS